MAESPPGRAHFAFDSDAVCKGKIPYYPKIEKPSKGNPQINTDSQVVDSVLCINPGTLSKRRGAGTYAAITLAPRSIATDEEREAEVLSHNVFERARVDVTRV